MKPLQIILLLVALCFYISAHADPSAPKSFVQARSKLFRDFPKPYPPGILISVPSQPFPLVIGFGGNAKLHDWERVNRQTPIPMGFHRPPPHLTNLTMYNDSPRAWALRMRDQELIIGVGKPF